VELDFEIDKITESIESAETGESFATLVLPLDKADLRGITRKNKWRFDWEFEFAQPERQVYKLIAEKETDTIQGLISFEEMREHVYMHLIENAPFNLGRGKKYLGVCPNLTAYCCKRSKELGFDGELAFKSKTALISHYEKTLGAVHIGGGRMIIYEEDAKKLLDKYFPEKEKKL
jgi:hypothetical protein